MRLGQLARKLALRPSQIVDFLSTQQVHLEEGSNARIEDDRVVEIVKHFAPERLQEVVINLKSEADLVAPVVEVVEETINQEVIVEAVTISEPVHSIVDASQEKPEVIKAPKVELTGLKVLGKIELPEPKKKEVVSEGATTESETPAIDERKSRPVKREFKPRKEFASQQPWRNPIAQQREREAQEAEEKKKAAAEREKERRKDNYLKKVKVSQPTKAVKLYEEQEESQGAKPTKPAPKTLWGKFINWLNN